MTKMTYAVAIDNALNGNITEEVRERLEALKASLAKRNSGSGKKSPTKTQKENEVLKGIIAEVLSTAEKFTVSEIIKADERLSELSNQKVSALLRLMVEEGSASKNMEGKKAYFSATETVEGE